MIKTVLYRKKTMGGVMQDADQELPEAGECYPLPEQALSASFRCECDAMRHVYFISATLEMLLGTQSLDLLGAQGQGLLSLIHPDDRPRIAQELELAVRRGGYYQLEYRLLTSNGIFRWMRELGRILHQDGVTWTDGQLEDIEQHKQRELKTIQSEIRFCELANLASDWFWEQDANLRFNWFSLGAESKLATAAQQLIGKCRWELPLLFVSELQMAQHRLQLEAHLPLRNFEYALITLSGTPVWYSVSGNPIFSPDGSFLGYRGIGRNIDARKQAELALKESETKLVQIIEGCPVPIFVINDKHQVSHWNRACQHLMGTSAEEVVGTSEQWRIFYPQQRPVLADMVMMDDSAASLGLARHYAGKSIPSSLIAGAIEAEDFFPNISDEGRWLYFTAAPLKDSVGNIVGAIETLQDFTERRRAEEDVRRLNGELNERNQELAETLEKLHKTQAELVHKAKLASLGAMVAGVAHELNTPVGTALMATTTLSAHQREFEQSAAKGLSRLTLEAFVCSVRQATELLERNLNRTSNLVNSFKQVAADQSSEQRSHFDLHVVVDVACQELSTSLCPSPYLLLNEVPEGISMDSFSNSLGQVLHNLIANALKHAFEEGGVEGRIRIRAQLFDTDMVRIVLDDNGAGIAAQYINRIFDPFYTTKMGQGSSGLGLNIVHNIVTNVLGGGITVRSIPSQGAEFTIELPLTAPRCHD
jgi:PAS domain S-box-containing protein